MRTNGIEYIKIQNFKGFQEEENFLIDNQHVLIYGPNGSGKSSVYWALYTLFQSSLKSAALSKKYFLQDEDENLLNINNNDLPAYIKIKTNIAEAEHEFILDGDGVTGDNAKLRELNQASEFISHRLLINFYNFRNSKEIDLFLVFERDILPFVFGEISFKDKVLSQVIDEISSKISVLTGRYWRKKNRLERGELAELNREIARLITFINENATNYLEVNFPVNEIKIKLALKGVYSIVPYPVGRQTQYKIQPPIFKLSVEQKKADDTWHPIERPQSFLNEARLTKIGIAIRFCLLEKRPKIPLKILALDDMLISLDLDNRVNLIKTILPLYSNEYQLFIFTHEKGFYNELKRNINKDLVNWKLFEFQSPINQKIRYKSAKSPIEKAEGFLENGDLENCALELRKLGEIILKNFLNEKQPEVFKSKNYVAFGKMLESAKKIIGDSRARSFQKNILNLELSDEEWSHIESEDFHAIKISPHIHQDTKRKILAARKVIFEISKSANTNNQEAYEFITELVNIKDRLLNYGAHPSDDALYETEMRDAMEILRNLEEILDKV